MKKSLFSAEDLASFHAAVEGATPLKASARVVFEQPKPRPRPRQKEQDEAAALAEAMASPWEIEDFLMLGETESYARQGISRKTLRDLRRGRWAIQDHTDLHGLNRYEAHEEVRTFLAHAQQEGKRCVRIVHGRGLGSPGREGVLRQLVRAWLVRRDDVLAFCPAPYHDGGEGALWILLKSPSR